MNEVTPINQEPSVLEQIIKSRNVVDLMADEKAGQIANRVLQEYDIDYRSMAEWRGQMENGIKLAKLAKTAKNTPFKNASNVKFPLITSAALQFNARAYPAIIQPDKVVSVRTWGKDPQGLKADRADRVAEHMNYQLLAEDLEWEAEMDKLLIQLPIVGFMVKKVWHDGVRKRFRTIAPGNFVVNDRVKTLDDAPRGSEILELYPDEITTRESAGFFKKSEREEQDNDKLSPEVFIEQHTRIDLDQDGYAEPYIATVHKRSQKLVRIIADFGPDDVTTKNGKVIEIRRNSYYVPYTFLPSMDGGFCGTGMGLLLGDTSETINTIINMMIDAGNRSSQGGGFLGNEFSMKRSNLNFQPGEWKTINTAGSALKDSIVGVTFPGPDATLFQLLGLLIDAGREIASVQDVLTGDTGTSQMTATTTMALIEQGLTVFTAAYQRIFRSLKQEFRLIAKINAATISPENYNKFHDGQEMYDPQKDYEAAGMDVQPVADPRAVTKMQMMAKAQIVKEMANEGLVDRNVASQRILEAASVPNREELAPKPDPMQELAVKREQAATMLEIAKVESEIAKASKMRADAMATLSEVDIRNMDAAIQRLEIAKNGMETALSRSLDGMATGPNDPNNAQGSGIAGPGNAPSGLAGGMV